MELVVRGLVKDAYLIETTLVQTEFHGFLGLGLFIVDLGRDHLLLEQADELFD